MIKKILLRILFVFVAIIIICLLIPQNLKMPVVGADDNSYNHNTFWHKGWGSSVVHKGVDVFAKKGTSIKSSTVGIVLTIGDGDKSGKFVLVLGPKWRLHYYAHLDEIKTKRFAFVTHDTEIGTVGNTGNAINTPAHLHYSIVTLIPYPWRIDNSPHGIRKMFYLNPIDYLKEK
ncbi:MAG: M23 family metallopeptidase [Bacteroidales bacterium]|nr:M23 family metallopeptidase [Bacteroidales bacterium]